MHFYTSLDLNTGLWVEEANAEPKWQTLSDSCTHRARTQHKSSAAKEPLQPEHFIYEIKQSWNKLVRLPIEARGEEKQREREREREKRERQGGGGVKRKREGEKRVMIKLHCEPSCKLSQSKRSNWDQRDNGEPTEEGSYRQTNHSTLTWDSHVACRRKHLSWHC